MLNSNINKKSCDFQTFEKNKYFYGKLMTVNDFEAEQKYFDEKRYLINRLLHGFGIVRGFTDMELIKTKEGEKESHKIKFKDGGMAFTCYGYEIVVPNDEERYILDETRNKVSDLSKFTFLYLKYRPYDCGYVAVASNSSNCEEKCRPGRVVDNFEVVASSEPPKSGIECRGERSISEWLRDLEEENKNCPKCVENQKNMVFLGSLDNIKYQVEQNEPERHRILFRPKELYQMFKCNAQNFESHVQDFESHVKNFNNPHNVTAKQVEALKSINSVTNPGGNIEFVVNKGSIEIIPDDTYNQILIEETHSERTDNPHQVTAKQVEALKSINSVTNPGGNIEFVVNKGSIEIIPDDTLDRILIGETHSEKTDNPHEVTASQTGALKSVDGISNPGGDIDLIEGMNIKITPDKDKNSIKLDCTLGLEIQPSDNMIKSIGPENLVGTSTMYARADHVHMLEDNSVDYNKLSAGLQEQLGILSMYVRERALKCSSTSFKKVAEEFKNDRAFDISLSFKKAIGKKLYEKEKDFIKFIDSMQIPIKEFAGEIRKLAEEGGFTDFENSLDILQKTIGEGIALTVATQQDEVCFYALELKLTVNDPMYKALNCTVLSFRKVAELFKSETTHNISFIFEKAVESRVYEDRDKFVKFMGENLELLRALSKELKIKASEGSLNDYSLSVEELAKSIDLNDAHEIAARQQDVCSHAQNLALSDDPINNPMYRALKCGAAIYREVSRKLQSSIADEISLEFEKAVNNRLYDNENGFIEFMEDNIDLLKSLPEEIEDLAIEKELTNYIAVVNELEDAIQSRNALEIAAKQEELCYFAQELDPSTPMYIALKCTKVNFTEIADFLVHSPLKPKSAKAISEKFENALNKKLYEEDDKFIQFMGENLELFETFAEEMKDFDTKETLTKYISSVEKLSSAIRSGEALEIATTQQEVCLAVKELDIQLHP